MNKILLLKGFNNYQNRIYRDAPTLQSYRETVGSANYIDYAQDRSFNINDGVSSEVTINITDPTKQDFMADYCIVYEVVKADDNSDNDREVIKSRWFVIEQRWNRQGQYIASLRRDLLVDYRNVYDTAPMLISKGYPTADTTELFNSEGLQYSQIKKYQLELTEHYNLQWLVCYLNKSRKGSDLSALIGGDRKYGYPACIDVAYSGSDISQGKYVWVSSPASDFFSGVTAVRADIAKKTEAVQRFAPYQTGITFDTSYDIIMFPYSEKPIRMYHTLPDNTTTYTQFGAREGIKIVSALKFTMQDDLYDVQLLPFSPVDGLTYDTEVVGSQEVVKITIPTIHNDLKLKTYTINWNITKEDNTVTNITGTTLANNDCYGLMCRSDSREFTLSAQYPYSLPDLEAKKVDSECRFIRLCSPNGRAMWDYNFVKNDEKPLSFKVFLTFKPGQPYMHIRPEFGGLYGQTFEDETRGLVDTSSYSISAVIDSWMQYIQQNSNYQSIFARQIESMETQMDIQKKLGYANALAGAVGAGLMGYTMGGLGIKEISATQAKGDLKPSLFAGAFGAISFAGGVADVRYNQMLMQENIDLTMDMHYKNLAQIKARPDTLTKVTNLDIDSHLVPYIEIYSASDDEINYLKNLLKYRGYTINRINTFSEQYFNAFVDGADSVFISGRLIECTGLNEDAHTFSELNNELMTGVRLTI